MAVSLHQYDEFAPDVRLGRADTAGTALVDRVYAKLCPFYDVLFGVPLQAGRVAAVKRMALRPGDRVLEVGTGTGIGTRLYPRRCRVTAIDLSSSMLKRARKRVAREGLSHVRLLEADAARLTFADEAFDCVYAPYVMSVVPDPVQVLREMRRVCRRGGRIVLLNHFRSTHPLVARLEAALLPLTLHVGFRSDLDLPSLLAAARLQPIAIEKVNRPAIWSLVMCIK